MKALTPKLGTVNLVLVLPALFLCACGGLHTIVGVEAANRLLDAALTHAFFRFVFSPVVVLGGPLCAAILNGWHVFGLTADSYDGQFIVALSIKHAAGRLIWLALASGLVLLLVGYALAENLKIVER